MTFTEIQEKINRNASVDFGEVFNNAFNLFQKIWVQGFIMQLILFGVMFGIMFIMYIPMMAGILVLEGGNIETGDGLTSVLILIGMLLFYLVFTIGIAIFSTGLQAAFYRQVRLGDRGIESQNGVSWGMFFRKKYFGKLFLISLASIGIGIAASLLCLLPIFM